MTPAVPASLDRASAVAADAVHHAGPGHAPPAGWALALAVTLLLVVPYVRAAAAVGAASGRPWSSARTASFTAGAVVVGVGLSPLLEAAGAARGHMLQHVALGMAAPLGLVMGAPVTLGLARLPVGRRRLAVRALAGRPVRTLTHPVTAALLHVGGLFALYLTPVYAATRTQPAVRVLVLAHVLLAGCLFAWSLAGPERAARRPTTAWRAVVLVAASAAHGYLAKLLYARAPLLPPGGTHTTGDVQDAAQLMYYAGDVAELALAAALFASWYRRSGRRSSPSPATVPADVR